MQIKNERLLELLYVVKRDRQISKAKEQQKIIS